MSSNTSKRSVWSLHVLKELFLVSLNFPHTLMHSRRIEAKLLLILPTACELCYVDKCDGFVQDIYFKNVK